MFYAGTTDKKTFGGIHVSEDGQRWTQVHKETAKDKKERGSYGIFGFARGNGMLVAVGGGDNISKGGHCRMLASKDGVAWEGPLWRFENNGAMNCVAFGKDRFVCQGGEGPWAYFSSSMDGKEWSDPSKNRIEKWPGWTKMILKLAYGNDRFVGIGATRRVITSSDGQAWKDHPDEARLRPPFVSLAYGNGVFVAGGMHGLRARSKDGETWDNVVNGEVGEHLNEILWTGTEFVALGIEVTYKSPDGVQWEKFPTEIRAARGCHGAGTFLCTNLRGTECYRSQDAVAWEAIPPVPDTLFTGALAWFE
ncbi:MAG TPA: hypothetical protein VNM14_20485 [Planctomycetota bacterium]|jgi:hypothetical protein|nr:hypothetical protein [Planctomycetota bacterium]